MKYKQTIYLQHSFTEKLAVVMMNIVSLKCVKILTKTFFICEGQFKARAVILKVWNHELLFKFKVDVRLNKINTYVFWHYATLSR